MKHGTVGWMDLTVSDAEGIRDFYEEVVGWKPEPVDMGEYSDFNMVAAGTGSPVAGVCHSRGSNAELPAVWMVYIVVPDIEASISKCTDLGGEVLVEPRGAGGGRYSVIKDPAGAFCALFETPPAQG